MLFRSGDCPEIFQKIANKIIDHGRAELALPYHTHNAVFDAHTLNVGITNVAIQNSSVE